MLDLHFLSSCFPSWQHVSLNSHFKILTNDSRRALMKRVSGMNESLQLPQNYTPICNSICLDPRVAAFLQKLWNHWLIPTLCPSRPYCPWRSRRRTFHLSRGRSRLPTLTCIKSFPPAKSTANRTQQQRHSSFSFQSRDSGYFTFRDIDRRRVALVLQKSLQVRNAIILMSIVKIALEMCCSEKIHTLPFSVCSFLWLCSC